MLSARLARNPACTESKEMYGALETVFGSIS